MSAKDNTELLKRYIHKVWGQRSREALDEFLAPTYKRHRSPTSEPLDREGQKRLLAQFQTAFPDAQLTVEEIIAGEDRVAFRSTLRGTHLGEFLGISPTGRPVLVNLVDIIHIEDGRFVEQWGGPDLWDLLRQLGAKISDQR